MHDDLGRKNRTTQVFCRVTGFTSDFLSFIVVEHIRFFHGALQLSHFTWVVQKLLGMNNFVSTKSRTVRKFSQISLGLFCT